MFDNLNNTNQSGHQPVDDIFAETDNASNNQNHQASGEITAQRVGLTAASGISADSLRSEPKSGGSGFKIAIILMVVVILGLLGFLAYNKFFKAAPIDTSSVPVVRTSTNQNNNATTVTNTETTSSSTFVANIPSVDTTSSEAISPIATTTTEINTATTTVPANVTPVDSDSDGLTDAEEVAAGTNINLIDTDNDGLSDYEEVTIYHTNPLVADTDGDGYPDGQEVRGGYDPNKAGAKLSGNLIK